jgi:ectoine hydroxylase-related dioxygenase (phytanoyl-CoA dioxygenase family)
METGDPQGARSPAADGHEAGDPPPAGPRVTTHSEPRNETHIGLRSDTATIDGHVAAIAEQGYTVLPDAIDASTRDTLRRALEQVETDERLGYAGSRFEGTRTIRIYNLLARGEAFWQVPLHPIALAIAERVLDPELLLSSLSAITLAPGEIAQPLHEDTQRIPLRRPRAPIALNAIWALSDFTEANGATRIVPGSHRFDAPPRYGADHPTVPAEMKAGSILLFDSALWHGGGANTTAERRWAIACYWCVGWMRQQENQQLGLPEPVVRRMPRRLQQLCGWSVWQGQYGHIDNHDPIERLGGPPARPMIWADRPRRDVD